MIIWVSQAFSLFGSAIVEFSLAWYLTIKTGSATVLATSMLVAMLPTIILGPLIGAFIDRWNRKWTMILADLSIAAVTLILVLLFLTNTIQIWHIYVALVLRAIGQTFHYPALQAAIPMIVPGKELTRAAGLNQILQGVTSIAGPPTGALLLGILPMQSVLLVDIITAVIAICIILPIVIPQPVRAAAAVSTSVVSEMMQGFRYIWSWRGLRWLVGISSALNFFLIPAFTMLPLMVTKYLDADVLKLGWLNSLFGVGVIAGGMLLGAWGGFKRRIVTAMIGMLIAGAATIALGLTSPTLYYLGLAACFLIGLGLTFANGPILAVLQSIVSKDMQGRVFSLLLSIGSAASPLGLAFTGPLADAIGIRLIYYIAGAAVLLVILISISIPSVMNIEKNTATQ